MTKNSEQSRDEMDLGNKDPGSAFLALIKDKDFGSVSAFFP